MLGTWWGSADAYFLHMSQRREYTLDRSPARSPILLVFSNQPVCVCLDWGGNQSTQRKWVDPNQSFCCEATSFFTEQLCRPSTLNTGALGLFLELNGLPAMALIFAWLTQTLQKVSLQWMISCTSWFSLTPARQANNGSLRHLVFL